MTPARVRVTGLVAAMVVLVSLVAGILQPTRAEAAIAADFDPGNIISDAVFFNSAAMSSDAVQAFLDARGANCAAGEQACLRIYTTATVDRAADQYCSGYTGGQVQSAAQVIVGVARSCGVNPRVLLVLLEKEQSLVTRSRPTTLAYRTATGFGCPDTAACDTQYYGFFNQLYAAARQYQVYAARPASYRYKAGQVNTVQYSPNAACGSSQVAVANQATAGLYNYTPYQPNAAALANLNGSGDGCSAYGNRNFWRLFSDWFGDPRAGSWLLRTADDPTVYVVSGTSKYVVGDLATMSALSPLGQVGFVSQQYLDRRTTAGNQGRVVVSPGGTVYFVDAGIKLPFSSCAQVADFGASCDDLVRWEQPLVDALHNGPPMTSMYRTTSGKFFYVTGGTKREVVDDDAARSAGLPTSGVTLLESGLANLPYGTPVTRDGVVLQNRSTGASTVSAGGTFTSVPAALRSSSALASLPVRPLDPASLARLTTAAVPGLFVGRSGSPDIFLLTDTGARHVVDGAVVPTAVPQVSAGFLALFPDAGTLAGGTFLKGSTTSAVVELDRGVRRKVSSWADLVAFSGTSSPQILVVDQRLVELVPAGPALLPLGGMVYVPRVGAVYFVNNGQELIPVDSFALTDELGVTALSAVGDADIAAYAVRPARLSTAVRCGGIDLLGLGGRLHRASPSLSADYGLVPSELDPLSCARLSIGVDLTSFLRAADGTIYLIQSGTKRPISSYARYQALGGTSANTLAASQFALSRLPTGAAA